MNTKKSILRLIKKNMNLTFNKEYFLDNYNRGKN